MGDGERFTCNICGAGNEWDQDVADRESASCGGCRSNMRFRSIALALSRALFGMDLGLFEFPRMKSLRGLGISDSDVYSRRLAECFSYTNTYYHRDPIFDLLAPDEGEFGKYDFVICSEVLEHVPSPVERAFETLGRVLRPNGVLILTAPYSLAGETMEHFPNLQESGLTEVSGRMVLVNRTASGSYEVFDRLTFHSGHGATLEMRLFSEENVRAMLADAGFGNVRFETEGCRRFGVSFSGLCSLPIVAAKGAFSLGPGGVHELVEQLVASRELLNAVKESRWVRLGNRVGLGPRMR